MANIQTEVEYYENYDFEHLVTPIAVKQLVKLLHETNYEEEKIRFLEEGFSQGFDIGYEGPEERQSISDNIPFKKGVGDHIELWNKLMKEVKLKRVAGPFDVIPFDNFMQLPIGLVPKAGNKTRLIFHLSYEFEKGIKKDH